MSKLFGLVCLWWVLQIIPGKNRNKETEQIPSGAAKHILLSGETR